MNGWMGGRREVKAGLRISYTNQKQKGVDFLTKLDGWMDCWMDGLLDGLLDGWIVGWIDGLLDGWE